MDFLVSNMIPRISIEWILESVVSSRRCWIPEKMLLIEVPWQRCFAQSGGRSISTQEVSRVGWSNGLMKLFVHKVDDAKMQINAEGIEMGETW